MSVMRPRPSRRLNSEWTWRCVKSLGASVVTSSANRGGEVGSRLEWYRPEGFRIPRARNELDPTEADEQDDRGNTRDGRAEARKNKLRLDREAVCELEQLDAEHARTERT